MARSDPIEDARYRTVIAGLERGMVSGGAKAFAMPRGYGKTSLAERAAIRLTAAGEALAHVRAGRADDAARAIDWSALVVE